VPNKRRFSSFPLPLLFPLGVNHVVITGDLTNLALESEFRRAAEIVDSFSSRLDFSVVPGNHDIYIKRSLSDNFFQKVPSGPPSPSFYFSRPPISLTWRVSLTRDLPLQNFSTLESMPNQTSHWPHRDTPSHNWHPFPSSRGFRSGR